MNPTVSVDGTVSPPGSCSRRVVTSSVAEKFVLDQHARLGQAIQQRRLSCVGVSDDDHMADTGPLLGLALSLTMLHAIERSSASSL